MLDGADVFINCINNSLSRLAILDLELELREAPGV
jgi:hypothetical protein